MYVSARAGACFSRGVLEGEADLQRDLGELETWLDGNLGDMGRCQGKELGKKPAVQYG